MVKLLAIYFIMMSDMEELYYTQLVSSDVKTMFGLELFFNFLLKLKKNKVYLFEHHFT